LILNYFRAKKEFSSGIVEGFNNKAKLTIRKSYGFRSDKLREIALYHTLGNLPVPEITHRFVWRGAIYYHGNKKSHVLHASGCQHYNCKNCTVAFKSANEAVRAGYRAHKACVEQ